MTETDEIATVLDEAARRWPDVSRSALIRQVLIDWSDGGRSPAARATARKALAGSMPGSAGLYNKTDDWPE